MLVIYTVKYNTWYFINNEKEAKTGITHVNILKPGIFKSRILMNLLKNFESLIDSFSTNDSTLGKCCEQTEVTIVLRINRMTRIGQLALHHP